MRFRLQMNRPEAHVPNSSGSAQLAAEGRDISDILCAVRNSFFRVSFIAAACVFAAVAAAQTSPTPQQEAPPTAPAAVPAPAPAPPQAAAPVGPIIVLDPAHGGTDTGARGENIAEKDVVLRMAQSVRAELERRGYRVVMTRIDDSNPSYDDRAAVANARRDAIFISLHASSTGTDGTVRAYYMQFAARRLRLTRRVRIPGHPGWPYGRKRRSHMLKRVAGLRIKFRANSRRRSQARLPLLREFRCAPCDRWLRRPWP